jgi:hypothetical protein
MSSHQEDYLDNLDRYLDGAVPACAYAEPVGGWGGKHRIVLDGGVIVLSKPVSGTNAGATGARREVAAAKICRSLGWGTMIAHTILRTMPSPAGGAAVETSLQVMWPGPITSAPALGSFEMFDVARAAAFDVAVQNQDRNNQNWLGMGPDMNGKLHLKLLDNSLAFDAGPTNSPFVAFLNGDAVPTTVRDEITQRLVIWPRKHLCDLIGDVATDAVHTRLVRVAAGDRLDAIH